MSTIKQNALVLKINATGEANLIAELLTRNLGLQKIFVPSGLRSLKRVGSRLGLFNHVIVEYRPKENGLHALVNLDLVTSYHGLSNQLLAFCLASYMAETYLKLIPDSEWQEAYFFLLGQCIKTAHQQNDRDAVYLKSLQLFFEAQLGYLLGFSLPPHSDWQDWHLRLEENCQTMRFDFSFADWQNFTPFYERLQYDFLSQFINFASPSLRIMQDLLLKI